jgi:hypothetical protein
MKMAEVGGYASNLRLELSTYYRWGLSVSVDEIAYGTEDMNQACQVLEESNYMRDFVEGPRGKVASVNFTRISD